MWVPAQEKQPQAVDLRRLTSGPKGYKERNKRKYSELEEDGEAPASMHMDEPAEAAAADQSEKRQKADDTTWRPVSGKVWKKPAEQASTVMKAGSRGRTSWAQKMARKDLQKQMLEVKREAEANAKAQRKAMHEQRRLAQERKKANQQKSAVVQKITNSATVKKLMKNKKQRKLLRTADTN